MTPFVSDPDFTLWHGDVREVLPALEPESVDCALTSPPFYALRDYGVDGQIGLEATPEEWVAELVGVFREVRRVLRPSGTLWVECGDSYAHNNTTRRTPEEQAREAVRDVDKGYTSAWQTDKSFRDRAAMGVPEGTKPKDLLGQPWLLAFALRADGWYLRQCIVWAKPNAMPESVRDRCTTAHSYLFLLSKQPRYWFDADAIAEPAEWARWGDQTTPKYEGTETASGWMQPKTKAELRSGRVGRYQERAMYGNGDGTTPRKILEEASALKNARSVWTIPTQGFAEAHFATWPEALVERVLKAGCPEWVCGTCGKPRERIVGPTGEYADALARPTWASGELEAGRGANKTVNVTRTTRTTGYTDCGHNDYRPGVALDPFMGSGTTALVARRLGRHAVGVELNEEYAGMAARRLSQLSLLA